jgi:hypothetical protein
MNKAMPKVIEEVIHEDKIKIGNATKALIIL